ncbi:hypothetical protein KKG52_03545 [Patescibacteria group bacterium]|nr:hypothetical protein [Patescibacteria group bacterium]
MDKNGAVGEILEKGQQVGDSVKSSAKAQVQNIASDVVGQMGRQESSPDQGSQANQQKQQQDNTQFIKDLYGVSENGSVQNQDPQSDMAIRQQRELEDKKKLEELRQKLHKEKYYDPLVNPQRQPEETTAQKLEREEHEEEKEKMEDLQEEKKKAPIAVSRAQTKAEIKSGIAG